MFFCFWFFFFIIILTILKFSLSKSTRIFKDSYVYSGIICYCPDCNAVCWFENIIISCCCYCIYCSLFFFLLLISCLECCLASFFPAVSFFSFCLVGYHLSAKCIFHFHWYFNNSNNNNNNIKAYYMLFINVSTTSNFSTEVCKCVRKDFHILK